MQLSCSLKTKHYNMRVFQINSSVTESAAWPEAMPEHGYLWVAYSRREFELAQTQMQAELLRLTGQQMMDLHIQDLQNNQLPSHYDYTSQYDVLIFRRLAPGSSERDIASGGAPLNQAQTHEVPTALYKVDTSPVAFALFDRVLVTVHPTDCQVRDYFAARLLGVSADATYDKTKTEQRTSARLPASSADLMLRLVNSMVDGYLELRRELTKQFDAWQRSLLAPRSRITNWQTLLDARSALHQLDDICEDQRSAIVEWIDALEEWPAPSTDIGRRERDSLLVRSRDVLEHIERVVHHVRRLEQSAENAVQLHFSAVGHRTNDIMRTLTAITAVFLPLNLITGIFGMNFEGLPLIHNSKGFAWAVGLMVVVASSVVLFFWWKRYLRLGSSK
jgi:magnesium transporter